MSLERIALDMLQHYSRYKYSPHATLHGFSLYWDPSTEQVSPDNRVFPDNVYVVPFQCFVDDVKSSDEGTWKAPQLRLPIGGAFDKHRLLGDAIANAGFLREHFIRSLQGELKAEMSRILYDIPLIVESAHVFIDKFDPDLLERDPQKCTLDYFLQHFDVDKQIRMKEPQRAYKYMHIRLQRESSNWEGLYMERLADADGVLHARLQGLFDDVAQGDFERQERLRMIEILLENGNAGVVDLLGADAYDVLVALYGEKHFPENKRHIVRGSVIRAELGTCRRRKPKVHDSWHRSMVDALLERGFKPEVYDRNVVVQRVLQAHFIAPYLQRAVAGEDVLPELRRDVSKAGTDWLRQRLYGYAVNHFSQMAEVRGLPHIRKYLAGVTIRA